LSNQHSAVSTQPKRQLAIATSKIDRNGRKGRKGIKNQVLFFLCVLRAPGDNRVDQLLFAQCWFGAEGTSSPESVDYPDFARAVAHDVSEQRADLGILVCGSGIGMAIAANKVDGVRAANVSSEYEAQMSREHNNANVLALGARILQPEEALRIVDTWLATPFAGGRHERRVEKIAAMEREERSAAEKA
jgi:ribose 5-phosphate isomerase B